MNRRLGGLPPHMRMHNHQNVSKFRLAIRYAKDLLQQMRKNNTFDDFDPDRALIPVLSTNPDLARGWFMCLPLCLSSLFVSLSLSLSLLSLTLCSPVTQSKTIMNRAWVRALTCICICICICCFSSSVHHEHGAHYHHLQAAVQCVCGQVFHGCLCFQLLVQCDGEPQPPSADHRTVAERDLQREDQALQAAATQDDRAPFYARYWCQWYVLLYLYHTISFKIRSPPV